MRPIQLAILIPMFCIATQLVAQTPPPAAVPQKEHELLKQLAGEWESESEGTAGPGQPATKCNGTVQTRMLGGLWAISDWSLDMQAAPMQAVQTIGYDPKTKSYVGTWVDSMMNHMWKYVGSVDATGTILTLEAEGPNFLLEGKMTKFRDVYEFKSADHIVATSSMLGADGKWITYMTGNMRRKK